MIDALTAYNLEKPLLAVLSTFYGLALLFYSPPRVKFKRSVKLAGFGMHLFAFLAHTFLLYLRVLSTGRMPFFGTYEALLCVSWCVSFAFVAMIWKQETFGYGRGATGVSWIIVFIAFMIRLFAPEVTAPRYLPPVLNSAYFIWHVIPGFVAYGFFTMAFFTALTSFVSDEKTKIKRRALAELYLWPGVMLFTVSLGLGAVWSRLGWGQWFVPEPKLIFSVITLGVFTLALGLRHSKGAGHKGFPWLVILGFALTVFTFLGTNRGLHAFM
ncbi:hypothetical protein GF359_04890 [candidate division WOR-3 bacterium]|uniref:Cytochrome c assembly protein domain-containing protein n=1 Tax=candidate division WOR-3 bacterium TaxID=2052148 RepID=A0A9D5K8X4_UNCW3|nr:hypothetical protein [candidate division WOR-3 bacterium]MBD3364531.1 hypothetical protein [candidate division WOR-3 bacterium]